MNGSRKYIESASIIIPAFNEEHRILPSLETLVAFCEENFEQYEIICVDDGSDDGTWEKITHAGLSPHIRAYRLNANQGKGAAVKYGMLRATGRFKFFTDADLPYALEAFIRAMDTFKSENCDVVVGARELYGRFNSNRTGVLRRTASSLFSTITAKLVRIEFKDTQCGFKGFGKDAAKNIFSNLQTSGYAFDVEIFALARIFEMKVCRVPVELVKSKGSKIRLALDPLIMLKELLAIWRRTKKL